MAYRLVNLEIPRVLEFWANFVPESNYAMKHKNIVTAAEEILFCYTITVFDSLTTNKTLVT